MERNIFSRNAGIHEIFKNEKVLYPEFIPERLPHRDREIDSLVYSFNPVIKGGKPINVSVFGPVGVGKTVTVKYVLNQLEEFTDRAKHLYVNCFEFNTRHSVLSKITAFLGRAIPRRGMATDETYSMFLEALEKSDFTPIIILDEVDQLFEKGEGSKLLYDLLRVFEYQKARIGIVMLSNNMTMNFNLDERVRSSFTEEKIVFNPYTPQQLKDILIDRAEQAFQKNVLHKDVIPLLAAKAAKSGGDCRTAIEALLKAGRLEEKENSKTVSVDHLRESFDSIESSPAKKVLKHLSEPEKNLLKILAQSSKELSSGELYEKYNESNDPLTIRRLREFVTKLSTLNIINAELNEGRGKTRLISLKLSKNIVLDELK